MLATTASGIKEHPLQIAVVMPRHASRGSPSIAQAMLQLAAFILNNLAASTLYMGKE